MLGESDAKHVFGYYRTVVDGSSTLVGGTETTIGTGETNTATLVNTMGDVAYTSNTSSNTTTTGDYAARLCYLYVAGGYDDWFLPSKDELNAMYTNLYQRNIGDFSTDGSNYYWSSSEYTKTNVSDQLFGNGGQYNGLRYNSYFVRPSRAF